MGHFDGLIDDDAELLVGGCVKKPSKAYGSGENYGQFKKGGGEGSNPGSFYGGDNYGKAKRR